MTPQAESWFMSLSQRDADRVAASLDKLEQHGPALARPLVGSIKGSRQHNLKELRPPGGNLRALFAFDPGRTAVMLVGGDKTNQWKRWYARNIPVAERLYQEHLQSTGRRSACLSPSAGAKSAHRGR